MINFISTFPPLVCGIGTYTSYLVSKMPDKGWKVFSFKLDELSRTGDGTLYKDRVSYEISISNPHLSPCLKGDLLWFQHSFGIWGKESSALQKMIKEANAKKKKVIVSFHTIHFESKETESGMDLMEERLLNKVLPWIDLATVFTDGAYRAVIRKFPQHKDKVVVLRHGVHIYHQMGKEDARKRLLRYLLALSPVTKISLSSTGLVSSYKKSFPLKG